MTEQERVAVAEDLRDWADRIERGTVTAIAAAILNADGTSSTVWKKPKGTHYALLGVVCCLQADLIDP